METQKIDRQLAEPGVRKQVEDYLNSNRNLIPLEFLHNEEAKEHIINIGTSIMLNKVGIDTYPGSFVKSILDNDLSAAVGRADHINQKVLPFYVTMMHNLRIEIKNEWKVEIEV